MKYEHPYSEISTNDKEIKINIKLPNVQKRNINLKIYQKSLEVDGIKKKGGKTTGFYRNISLPENVLLKKANASFKKETLKIRIPLRKLISPP